MPIERGDSWFSPKCIEVQRRLFSGAGRALDGLGASPGYQSQPNSEWYLTKDGSETAGDKLGRRKGNSPDPLLRSPKAGSVLKEVGMHRQPGCWLRSSHHLKSA